MIRFCNKSFGSKLKAHFFRFCLVSMIRMKSFGFELKAHFFSNFFCFELQSHFLNLIYIVQFQTLHSWFSNGIVEFWTSYRWVLNPRRSNFFIQKHHLGPHSRCTFFDNRHRVDTQDENVLIFCHEWEHHHLCGVFIYHGLRYGFSTR